MATGKAIAVVVLALGAGCQCRPGGIGGVGDAELIAEPTALTFAATYVGQERSLEVAVTNRGAATASSPAAVDAPFEASPTMLRVARGDTQVFSVRFEPVASGHFSTTLQLGTLSVAIEGDGVEVPECHSNNVCASAAFDFDLAACNLTSKPDNSACASRCVIGSCVSGQCQGQFIGCDDSNLCTDDACSEADGCAHIEHVCPPISPCKTPRCDPALGCMADDALDGTVCGVDDCLEASVDVCIAGVCVSRPRPSEGRCSNTWVTATVPTGDVMAMAYDAARRRVVLLADRTSTWEYDGARWSQRFPAKVPSYGRGYSMAYDSTRRRVMLFGGGPTPGVNAYFDETWEWDGMTWVQRHPTLAPPGRLEAALAYDSARKRLVLFGGYGATGILEDTWEWDGFAWTQRHPITAPSGRYQPTMAYDSSTERLLLWGGSTGALGSITAELWAWDGVSWAAVSTPTSPPALYGHAMVFDDARSRLVLFGGTPNGFSSGVQNDTWEWDGQTWASVVPAASPPARYLHSMVYDSARKLVVMVGGAMADGSAADTWVYDGKTWLDERPASAPSARMGAAMIYDAARAQTLLVSGYARVSRYQTDTWSFDGSEWARVATGPSDLRRYQHSMAYDRMRQRVVLFGGRSDVSEFNDTWEWDGLAWGQSMSTAAPPPSMFSAIAFDAIRNRTVLVGIERTTDTTVQTWEYDGHSWSQHPSAVAPPARRWHGVGYDIGRARTVLFGGTSSSQAKLNDTWEWDGTTWVRLEPTVKPRPQDVRSMAYDVARQRLVVVGSDDTWEWNGVVWSALSPNTSPTCSDVFYTGESACLVVFDEARQKLTAFDGSNTWIYLR